MDLDLDLDADVVVDPQSLAAFFEMSQLKPGSADSIVHAYVRVHVEVQV